CIHDAARPFITTKNLDRCLEACTQYSGAITAIPSPDTVKQISVERMVIRTTLPRETIWLAQTPQVFERELIQSLLLTAARSDQTVTDEASLAEQAGIEVAIVEGSPMNRKITTWEDWQWAVARVNRNEAADAH
ncbi:MAG: 2-C-methyl-D-erythritol 4-phosphate cytidylyltransferase, partial [Fidelibacterota bacterium]